MTLQIDLPQSRVRLYGNIDNAELVSSIPITGRGKPYKPVVVMSVDLGSIKNQSLIFATAEYQVTTPYTYNVMIASYLVLADSKTGTTGFEINERSGQNFNREEHHFRDTRVGWFAAKQAYARQYLNLVLYTASTAALSGHKMTVDKDYGRLSALVIGP